MRAVAVSYAVILSALLAASIFVIPHADALVSWGKQHLEPALGKYLTEMVTVLTIVLPPGMFVAVLVRAALVVVSTKATKRRHSN